jgi:hypothetical protein
MEAIHAIAVLATLSDDELAYLEATVRVRHGAGKFSGSWEISHDKGAPYALRAFLPVRHNM